MTHPGTAQATPTHDSPAPRLALATGYLGFLEVDVGPIVSLGPAPYGERRVVAIVGGRIDGPRLRGRVVPRGADWQIVRADGVVDIEAHYLLELDDGAGVEIVSSGLRHGPPEALAALARGVAVDPAAYFFRTFVRFQTGSPAHLWLNRTMAIAVGARRAATVELTLYAVQ